MSSERPRPIIMAHRGARAQAPENTLASFQLAFTQGADAIELDAKLTADGQIIVFHDSTLDRTTNGTGSLATKTLAELRELDAGSSFSPQYRGEKIPLLEEVFDALGKRLLINVELKNYATPSDMLVKAVCDLVIRCGLQKQVIFSSFLARNLKLARRYLPEVPRGLLAYRGWMGAWARSFGFTFGDYAALHPSVTDVDAREVQRVHRIHRQIYVWTVNNPNDMLRLRNWGVDGIFTDDPALARQVLGGPRDPL
jgi:glycerophosphoryl diester phosphodiesterase